MAEEITRGGTQHANVIKTLTVPVWVSSTQSGVAGWVSGAAGIVVGHPFDTIKTLQQTQTVSKTSVKGLGILRDVWRGYGVKGLYRGLTYPVITYGAVNAAFFCGAEYARGIFTKGLPEGETKLSFLQLYIVGCVGGVLPVAIMCPTEFVKVKMQDQLNTKGSRYTGSIDCTRKLFKQYGPRVFTRGMVATALRDIYTWGFYLVTFEMVKDMLANQGCHYIVSELIAGGMAGSITWTLATPFDVVKSRIQASDKKLKTIDVIKALYKENGLKAFTRGMFWSAFRAFPSNAVTLFGYTEMMRWFDRSNKNTYS